MPLQQSTSQPFLRPMIKHAVIRVAIIDGFPLLRIALRSILGNEAGISLVGEAQDCGSGLDLLQQAHPQVVVLETSLPDKDPLETIREIIHLSDTPKVLVLSSDDTPHYALRMLRAGAYGFLPTKSACEEIVKAVRTLAGDRIHLPSGLQEILTERYLRQNQPQLPEDRLSDREFQVMKLLAKGYTNREIASKLFIGIKTVDTHRANMLRKLNLRNNVDVARFAIQNGFVRCSRIAGHCSE